MGEVGLYVGTQTAMAATARGEYARRTMGAGPLGWLAIVAKVITGRDIDGRRPQDPAKVAYCRGILRGLGYDPDTHTLSRRTRPAVSAGLIVRDHLGEPCEFVSQRRLRDLSADADFLAGFAQETE